MRIDNKLNLVIPVDTAGGTVYVHATPISREVFEKYFLVISKAFAALYSEGLSVIAGPRVGALMLKRVAEDLGEWSGPGGVEQGLMAEIRRLTNVIHSTPQGWVTVPYYTALTEGVIDGDDVGEVEGILCFFTVASSMHKRDQLPSILDGIKRLWGAESTLLNSTEYGRSLQTSIEEETSSEMLPTSLVPS